MQPRDHLSRQGILFPQFHDATKPMGHRVDGFRDHGGQGPGGPILQHRLTGPAGLRGGQGIGIEVDPGVSINLEIEVAHR